MVDPVKTLDEMIRENIQDGGYAVTGGRDLFMELLDAATGLVWMSTAPVTLTGFVED